MPAFAHTVIRASAGTGKTFQLSNRFLGLMAAEVLPDQVLATTFARKAAGEILERVLSRLAAAADDKAKLAELGKHLSVPGLSREACLVLLQGLIRRLHRLRIGTLDAFFIQLAGSFGLELGLPPGWGICDEITDAGLRWEAIQEVLRNEETHDVVQLMHLLGKGELRRSITEQILGVVNDLYGLFIETEKEAWHRLKRQKELGADELTLAVAAFEAFGDFPADKRFPKAHLTAIERAKSADWGGFLGGGLAGKILGGDLKFYGKEIGPGVIDAYQPVIDHAVAVLLNRVSQQTEASWRLLSHFDEVYRRLKRERRAMRFEDVTRELARNVADVDAADLAFRLDAHIGHLLLDEFQDTSLPQWNVLQPAAARITRKPADESFFCVGDVKQAIYGWRGGLSAVFEAVTERLPNLVQQPLNESYRSSPPVIETVNAVFSALGRCAPLDDLPAVVELWGKRFQPHTTARMHYGGYCRLATAPRAAEGQKQKSVTLGHATKLAADLAQRDPGRSIGVLVRTNEAVARVVYELREKHNVAASEEGGNPLTDSTGVQIVLSAMALADHPGDLAARFHLAHSPLAGTIGATSWNDDAAAMRASRGIREALLRDGYGRTVYGWVKALAPEFDERELKRMLQLVELAYRYESQATVRCDDFAQFVEETRVEDPSSARVRVMTIHQAKGLEFDIVVLPELDARLVGQMPSVVVGRDDALGPVTRVCRYAGEPAQSLLPAEIQALYGDYKAERASESLCVLYVALTRAVHELHMVISPAKENEKSIGATFAGVLRTTLAPDVPAAPETVLYECGDKEWRYAEESEPEALPTIADEDAEDGGPIHVRLAQSSAKRTRGLKRRSPSAQEGGGRVNLSRMMRLESSVAMARGSLVHKWFEQIEWLDDGEPGDAVLSAAADGVLPKELSLKREIAEFREMLARPAIREALSRSGYAPPAGAKGGKAKSSSGAIPSDVLKGVAAGAVVLRAEPERTFAFRTETEIVPGSIDRLVTFLEDGRPVAAEILDFKTDNVSDPAALEDAVNHYRPQMDAYRQAVSRMLGLASENVSVRLLFVGEGMARHV